MFQEGDWNDGTDAQALTKSLRVHSGSTPVSQRAGVSPGAGRKKTTKHLLETLRVLQSTSKTKKDDHTAPAVKDTSGSDDSAAESAPVKTKRKKKRSKRRRQGQSADVAGSEQQGVAEKRKSNGPEPCETPWKKKPAGDLTGNFQQEKRSDGSEHPTEDAESKASAAQLSRKQWKNKQKNKRKNKNKFKGGAEAGDPPRQTELEAAENRVARPAKITCSVLKENRGPSQGPEFQKGAVAPTSSKTAMSKPTGVTPQGSASEGNAKAAKLKVRQLAKLKKILEKQGKVALEVGGGIEGGAPVTKVQEPEPTLPAPVDRSSALRTKMEDRLKSARFRFINQQLYTSSSKDAQGLFQQDPEAFDIYHSGFRTQVERWPENPVDLIIKYLRNRPASLVVADFGCGDCKIARSVRNTVHSFDLAALNEHVTVCDMANVPLPDESVDIAVFCLALMGTNLREFFDEANRVLKQGGILKVAEVASRFEDIRMFISALANLGFKNTAKDTENDFFYMFEFTKTGPPKSKGKLLGLELKACLYKKR